MLIPPLAPDEPLRIRAVRQTNLLDTPLEERFERVTRLARRLMQVPVAAITLIDVDRQWFKSIQGFNVTETTRSIAFCAHTVLQEGVLVIPDMRVDSRFADHPFVAGSPNIIFYAGCPIRSADGAHIGSVCVLDLKPHALDEEDMQVLEDLARIAETEFSSSLNSMLQQDMVSQLDSASRQAQVDSLTRLWNRQAVFQLLGSEIARAQRTGHGAGAMMVDIDHFKQINDTKGHAAGDAVLREAAKRMLAAIREVDALGRYGGEEFLIALGECSGPEGARLVGERIRQRISERPIDSEFGPIPITVSVGIAFCKDASEADEQSLVIEADKALYRAKHGGRNRVESSLMMPNEAPAPSPL